MSAQTASGVSGLGDAQRVGERERGEGLPDGEGTLGGSGLTGVALEEDATPVSPASFSRHPCNVLEVPGRQTPHWVSAAIPLRSPPDSCSLQFFHTLPGPL